MCESFHYVMYKKTDKQLHLLCDSLAPRYLTATCPLDYDSMAGADKFGNVWVSRLPAEVRSRASVRRTSVLLRACPAFLLLDQALAFAPRLRLARSRSLLISCRRLRRSSATPLAARPR